ncbi:MAG: hypothetical protein D8M58_16785 [Calditrichaeota bacterium]|nr:MAG: hypothetical protein DWQ03_11915 [Calditrichota bacterium]MBL1207063.1 hypothetical protein [Calditrichota bacterium]NOG46893.1 PorV/PorQ family protein [Calditrichota bacterium]
MKIINLLKAGLFSFIFFLLIGSVSAQEVSKVGTSAAPFLKIPVSARATALGGAFVAMADDPSALFWNPGGIARIENFALMVDHSPWLPGLQHNFIGLTLPVENFGTIGLSITSLSTEEMDITTLDHPMGTGEVFDAQFISVGFSYGVYLTDRFSIGATFKFINERIYNSSATGIAVDIGTLYDTPLEGLKLGFNISNFGTKMNITGEDLNVPVDIDGTIRGNNESIVAQLKTDEFDLPLMMQVGLSYEAFTFDENKLIISIDGINPSDNDQSVNTGAELSMFNNMFVVRGGFNEMLLKNREKGLTLGAGFNTNLENYFNLRIDYAFQEFVHLNNVNRFSLMLLF